MGGSGKGTSAREPAHWAFIDSTHLQWAQGCGTCQHRRDLAGALVHVPAGKGRQQVGHTKVRHKHTKRVQGINENVGGPQVPVQDAQGVQVQQGSGGLLQQGEDTGQGQATLHK
jgi:hypothetical protein